jgi:hypothetical protein
VGYLLSKRRTARIVPRKPSPCKAKPITEILNSDSWAGKRSFILCGGPSLEGFDFNRIRNEKTIGINKSFSQFDTTICYAMDQRFYDSITYPNRADQESVALHNAWLRFPGLKAFLKVNEKTKLDPNVYYVEAIKKRLVSLDISQGIYAGGNSGFGGMMLAIALGSRQIYLLGADLKVDEKRKKTHWHEGYKKQKIENLVKVLKAFKKEFEHFAEAIRELGVEVVNLNPDSALECFPKKDIREVI